MLYYLCVLMLAQFVHSHFLWVVVMYLAFRVMWRLGLRQYTGVGM